MTKPIVGLETLNLQLIEELAVANKELLFQGEEKAKRAAELVIANKEKADRASELVIANNDKDDRAAELVLANIELAFQNEEKAKRVAELVIATIELAYQNKEKGKRVTELLIANDEKAKRAAELVIINKELFFLNEEKALLLMHSSHQDLLTVATDGIHILDMQGNLLQCSFSFAHMLGYARAEMINLNVCDWDANFSPKQILELFAEIATTRKIFVTKNRCKDGTLIDMQVNARMVQIEGKDCIYASSRDITQQLLDRAESDFLAACMTHSNDAVIITEAEPRSLPGPHIVYVNDAFSKLTGYTREEAIGNTPRMLQGPKSEPVVLRKIHDALSQWQPVCVELINYAKDGREFWVELDITPIANADGWYTHWISVQRDITERKQLELVLANNKAIIDSTGEAIVSKNLQDVITSWNPAAEKLYGYLAKEAIGQNISILACADSNEYMTGLMKRVALVESISSYETYHQRKDGRQIPVKLALSPIRDLQGKVIGISSVGHDISERVKLEQQVREMAFHDTLTKLPNRRLLEDRINLALASNRRYHAHSALLYIDLDNFKPLNDMHGHEAGDMLLQEVAKRLLSNARAVDTVSRVGGDEFVVLLTDLDEEECLAQQHTLAIAEKIRLSLEDRHILEVRQRQTEPMVTHICSVSIGLVLFSETEKSYSELLNEADAAMYEAKHAGRNTIRVCQPKI